MIMLDICSGLAGASKAMRERGWRVVTVDIDPSFSPDVVADVRDFVWQGERPDLIWCSPPCDEFSREFMPWCKTGVAPSMDLVLACKRIIDQARPRFWVIENVRGAVRYFEPVLGKGRGNYGAFFLWGNFPDLGQVVIKDRKKESYPSSRPDLRAMIPAALSLAMARAIERQPVLI